MTRPQPELPPRADSPSPDFLERWDGKLNEILARVEAIERSLFEPNAARPSPAPQIGAIASDAEGLAHLVRQLFESQQESLAGLVSERLLPGLASQQASLHAALQAVRDELAALTVSGRRAAPPLVATPPRPARSADASAERDWRNAIFGPELASDSHIARRLDELSERVRRGDSAASVLAGQLLVFQGAAPERRPQLLKDIGEALYRAFPELAHSENDFEKSLARSLERGCEPAGFQNAIEFVRVGQRFDSTRHLADGPGGVEITGVSGWVVLRGRDKVYTKAVVAAR
ncbi:MAG TPA: hypothetical protein VGM05_34455 [Planctomycetaceae bacterium]|jgi:hypothetical protein